MKIHHVGYAVKNIDKALDEFLLLGFKILSKQLDEARNINIIFIEKDNYIIELISPQNVASPINKILTKNGPIPYHLCYESSEFQKDLEYLVTLGWVVIEKPKKAIAIDNSLVAFLYSKHIGIVEILEKKE